MQTQVETWYSRAQIDYVQGYMALYASFNAWYQVYVGTTNDREAINALRAGVALWDEYSNGTALRNLAPRMRMLVEMTQREPISYATPHWRGEVTHTKDWPSLVEFWYRVRCLVMHGHEIRSQYVYLAYETLNIFMGEVVRRMKHNTSLLEAQKKV